MTSKRVFLRSAARADVEAATDWYIVEAGDDVALRFVDSLDNVLAIVGQHPALGSPRYAHVLRFPGLRSRRVRGFPYLVFYVEADERIEVLRLVHTSRSIARWLLSADEEQ